MGLVKRMTEAQIKTKDMAIKCRRKETLLIPVRVLIKSVLSIVLSLHVLNIWRPPTT